MGVVKEAGFGYYSLMEQAGLFEAKRKEKGCAFCRIIKGEAPAVTVFEDDRSVAFFDHRPLLKGHLILAPKEHHETLDALPEALAAHLFRNARLLSSAVEEALNADGSFVALNNKVSQSVPHVHIHVVPRWKKDGLFSKNFVWVRRPYRDEAEMRDIREKIKEAVSRALKKTVE